MLDICVLYCIILEYLFLHQMVKLPSLSDDTSDDIRFVYFSDKFHNKKYLVNVENSTSSSS
ncbi:unnamed protein product [Trichobilharzia regenti]|nr:unnamed protein product [Trichobilharzia regenti]